MYDCEENCFSAEGVGQNQASNYRRFDVIFKELVNLYTVTFNRDLLGHFLLTEAAIVKKLTKVSYITQGTIYSEGVEYFHTNFSSEFRLFIDYIMDLSSHYVYILEEDRDSSKLVYNDTYTLQKVLYIFSKTHNIIHLRNILNVTFLLYKIEIKSEQITFKIRKKISKHLSKLEINENTNKFEEVFKDIIHQLDIFFSTRIRHTHRGDVANEFQELYMPLAVSIGENLFDIYKEIKKVVKQLK
eukprot:GAHX01003170.1.p1 GENE.GAHX01003170.1~~GAHX01003170.1.p1  ORF type:complete len:279 (+),score=41.29 GAHX01003170.1:109-837(+)